MIVDSKGLKYRFEAPKTTLGDELLEHIRLGNIAESSFAFIVAKEEWEKKSDDTWKRTIKKFNLLFDVSPVYDAAYSKTSVDIRGKEKIETEIEEKRLEEEKRQRAENYDRLINMLNNY